MIPPAGNAPGPSRGVRDYVSNGWLPGGAAMGFVLGDRALKRFVLIAAGVVLVSSAAVAVAAVALRREAGPVGYLLVGMAAYYCLSLMVIAAGVGLAHLVADRLDSRPVTPAGGWRVIERRRRSIAGWAVVDLALGLPSRVIGSWTVDWLGVLLIGFGWGLVSFFAIPAIALVGGSPWATARRSLRLVRSHWGEAVSSTVYLWVRALVLFGAPAAVAVAAGVLLIRGGTVVLGGALFAAGVSGLALAYLLAQSARAVLTVVLYRYADSGTVYPAFPAELLERSVRGPPWHRPARDRADRGRPRSAATPASARRPGGRAVRRVPRPRCFASIHWRPRSSVTSARLSFAGAANRQRSRPRCLSDPIFERSSTGTPTSTSAPAAVCLLDKPSGAGAVGAGRRSVWTGGGGFARFGVQKRRRETRLAVRRAVRRATLRDPNMPVPPSWS